MNLKLLSGGAANGLVSRLSGRFTAETGATIEVEDEFTSSFFVNTDLDNNQIASFYIGAMGKADSLSFHDLDHKEVDVAIISPNAPAAMVKYVRECQELGVPYIYDPSQQIVRLGGDELLAGTRGARMLIVNEYEFGMLKNKTGLPDKELLAQPEMTIITLGEQGSRIFVEDQALQERLLNEHEVELEVSEERMPTLVDSRIKAVKEWCTAQERTVVPVLLPQFEKQARAALAKTYNALETAGFNDDTRAFPSIPARHDLWRRVSANWVAGLAVRGIVDEDDAAEMILDLAYRLAKQSYKFE